MKWRDLGSIEKAKQSGCSGVYLIVHNGKFNRVVYVGVSINVGRRIREHYDGYLRGNRTICNIQKNQDIYSLLSAHKIRNHIKEYQALAKNMKIWGSTTLYKESVINLLAENQVFDSQWEDFVRNKYIPNLSVLALPMSNYSYEDATRIESVIQNRLIKAFDLRGFFNVKNISLLGKIEHPKLTKLDFDIEAPPRLDVASQLLLSNLNTAPSDQVAQEIIFSQLENEIKERERTRKLAQDKSKNRSSKYKKYGTPWTIEDLEKLRVMVVDFELSPLEMTQYLDRPAGTISKRIEINDRLSNKMWRKSLNFQ